MTDQIQALRAALKRAMDHMDHYWPEPNDEQADVMEQCRKALVESPAPQEPSADIQAVRELYRDDRDAIGRCPAALAGGSGRGTARTMTLPASVRDWPVWARDVYEERAAIMEYDARLPLSVAEAEAERMVRAEAENNSAACRFPVDIPNRLG